METGAYKYLSLPIDCGAVALGVLDWPKEYIKQIDNYILTGGKRRGKGAYGLKTPELISNLEAYLSQRLGQYKGKISSVEIKSPSQTPGESFTPRGYDENFKSWFQTVYYQEYHLKNSH